MFAGINGAHSPHSALNGRTPSPPAMANTASSQQLPPACGARQLSKLKRFLTTLQQFGSDISPEIGERVRSLVLGLVVSILHTSASFLALLTTCLRAYMQSFMSVDPSICKLNFLVNVIQPTVFKLPPYNFQGLSSV